MNQVEELVKVVAEAQADKGNVVIVTGKPGSGKSKVLREAAESQKWTYVDCRMLISEEFLAISGSFGDARPRYALLLRTGGTWPDISPDTDC